MKITNGQKILGVTKGAYENMFKQQGYRPYDEKAKVAKQESKESKKTEDEIFCEELRLKPISEWTKDETIRYVSVMGIDLKGETKPNEIKDIIKATF